MHDEPDSTVGSGREASSTASIVADLSAELGAAFAQHDKPAAVRTAVEAVTSGAISIATLYRDVLTPLLVHAGASWQDGRLSIWEEHLASATVRTVVEILYPGVLKAKAAAPPAHRTVLLACPPEEGHDLGSAHGRRPVRHGGLDHLLPGPGHAGRRDRRRGPPPGGGRHRDEFLHALPQGGRAPCRRRTEDRRCRPSTSGSAVPRSSARPQGGCRRRSWISTSCSATRMPEPC